jgi:hypothetical protein
MESKMKITILLLFFCLLICSTYYSQDITEFTHNAYCGTVIVSIEQEWTDTGIQLKKGDTLTIIVEGIASTDAKVNLNSHLWVGPEGEGVDAGEGYPCPYFSSQSVIGKIGEGGTPFGIGKTISFRSEISDKLFLGYNDTQFGDNYGYYVAFIFNKDFVSTRLNEKSEVNITDFSLHQNFPNPFNPSTIIRYNIPNSGNLEIKIFDITGSLVKTLFNSFQRAGLDEIEWNGKNEKGELVSSGTYIYQIKLNENILTKKMMLLK